MKARNLNRPIEARRNPERPLRWLTSLLVLFGLLVAPALSAAAESPASPQLTWSTYTVDAPKLFFNMSTRSLAYRSDGIPCIAYGGDHLYYACFVDDSDTWAIQTIDTGGYVGQAASLAFDNTNQPRISYYDAQNRSLKMAYWLNNQWNYQVVDTPNDGFSPVVDVDRSAGVQELLAIADLRPTLQSGTQPDGISAPQDDKGVGMFSTIAVDKGNKVHISYYDGIQGVLKHAIWDGINWNKQVVDSGPTPVGSWPALALYHDNQNNVFPRIAYMSEKYDDLKYAEWDGNSWDVVTVEPDDPFTNVLKTGPFASLAVDGSGVPHISYLDFSDGYMLKYATVKGSAWSVQEIDSGNAGWDTSIAVDSNKRVHISYYDYDNGDLKYVRLEGGKGTPVTVFNDGDQGRFTSLVAFGSSDVHISFLNVSTGMLELASWNGKSWSSSEVDQSADVGMSSSLDLTTSGSTFISYFNDQNDRLRYTLGWPGHFQPHTLDVDRRAGTSSSARLTNYGEPRIAYYDAKYGNLRFAYREGNRWYYMDVDTSSNDVGLDVSLALEEVTNRPRISYYDATDQNLKYAFWDGSKWLVELVDTAGDVGQFTSLALTKVSGTPYISYYDATNQQLKLAYRTGTGTWLNDVIDSDGNVGQYSSLKFDSMGVPNISYYDATRGVLKFAEKEAIWVFSDVDTTADVGMYSSLALDALNIPHISYYDATNGDLKFAVKDGFNWLKFTLDSDGIVGMYTSIDLNGAGQPGISYYDYSNGDLKFAAAYPFSEWQLYLPYARK